MKNTIPTSEILQAEHVQCSDVSMLQCPSCHSQHALITNDAYIHCSHCDTRYPYIGIDEIKIPFLFDCVDAAKQGWSARLNGFNQQYDHKIDLLTQSLQDKKLIKSTRKRITKTLQNFKKYQSQVNQLLIDFKTEEFDSRFFSSQTIDKNQGVDSYINNIFRDWCWENGENQANLDVLKNILPNDFTAEHSLVLGAGSARLAVDFHQEYEIKHSALLDINPLLLGLSKNIISGKDVDLIEFPLAPLSVEETSVSHVCKLSSSLRNINAAEFEFFLGDVLNAPFADKAFDCIFTPWLIDILPVDLCDFIPHINRLLSVGGVWVNTGSLAFLHNNCRSNYSKEEVLALLGKYGFEVIAYDQTQLNYLQSPYSAHGRVETVFSFHVRKQFDCKLAKTYQYIPEWIEDVSLTIPQEDTLVHAASNCLLQAQVLSAINGQTSIEQIADLVAKQYQLPFSSALIAVRSIIMEQKDIK